MQRQLKLVCRPNNQISLFSQWVTTKAEERFLAIGNPKDLPDELKDFYRSGRAAWRREQEKKYDYVSVRIGKNPDGSVRWENKKNLKPVKVSLGNRREIPPLDITKNLQRRPKSLRGWGLKNLPKKFTNKSGQKIRECGAMIDKICGGQPDKARVITLTLPANYDEAFAALASYSGYIINRLFQHVRRSQNPDIFWFFVWEYQKRGALHLHICLASQEKELSSQIGEEMLQDWHQILCDISQKSGICMFSDASKKSCTIKKNHQNLNQEMRKSCGAYFSKYASKGENIEENSYIKKFSKMYPPSQFWGSSRNLKNLCKEFSYEKILAIGEAESASHLERVMELILLFNPVKYSSFSWKKKIHEGTERETIISEGECQSFYLSPCAYEEFLALFKNIPQGISLSL